MPVIGTCASFDGGLSRRSGEGVVDGRSAHAGTRPVVGEKRLQGLPAVRGRLDQDLPGGPVMDRPPPLIRDYEKLVTRSDCIAR